MGAANTEHPIMCRSTAWTNGPVVQGCLLGRQLSCSILWKFVYEMHLLYILKCDIHRSMTAREKQADGDARKFQKEDVGF